MRLEMPPVPVCPAGAVGLEALTYPRGLLGHAVQYVVDTAGLPDRGMALASALSALAKGIDRKVMGPTLNSTVLFIQLLAETGAGKQHAINCIRMKLRAMGEDGKIVASGLASVQAIEEIVEETPSALVLIDEVGSWLTRISSKGQTGNVSEIPGTLQSLWGWPLDVEWVGTKKRGKEMKKVHSPTFSWFGTSTERPFLSALKKKELASGFVSRMLLFNVGRGALGRIPPKYDWRQMPEWLAKALKARAGRVQDFDGPVRLMIGGRLVRDFQKVGWGEGVEQLWLEFDNQVRAMPCVEDREIWIRAPEMAERLATVVAWWRGSAVIDAEDWRWARAVAEYSTKQLVAGISKYMREELNQTELVERIRDQFHAVAPDGDGLRILTDGMIRKHCERLTNDLGAIEKAIQHLDRVGDIVLLPEPVRPGPKTRYWGWTRRR
jgi:hypothetical protein